MPEKINIQEKKEIEIRSEVVQEILGATPRWILRSGITIILFVIIGLFVGSWFFKYPDIIQSKIVLTTQNPPVSLQSHTQGKIMELFVSEKQKVSENEIIAIIENTANYKDVLTLKQLTDTIKDIQNFSDSLILNVGEIQQVYSSFIRLVKNYKNFIELNYYEEKIKSLEKQKYDNQLYYKHIKNQNNFYSKENLLAEQQFERDKQLFNKNVISKLEFEKSEQTYLQQQVTFESSKSNLVSTQMQINQINQQILDLKLLKAQENNKQDIEIEESFNNLKSQIGQWEKTYIIRSPISGNVTFTKIWSKLQNVSAGEQVATIIPFEKNKIIGRIEIPSVGMGKVKMGQKVNIKFDNYPYMEFGLVRGKVSSISQVPSSNDKGIFYIAEIEVPDTLKSNYGKILPFSQEMSGTAEIITEELRLLERILNPLRSIWKSAVDN